MKSIRTNPNAGAPEGDERIRTAAQAPGADPVYEIPGLTIFGQHIRSWAGWPDDVRETIREWNRSKGLSFSYAGTGRINGIKFFRCEDCDRLIEVRAADRCVLRGKSYCEDCLIALARGAGS